jgi:hypothetical protein
MTVIRPNSISGITSITAQGDTISLFRSDGTTVGALNLNVNASSGVSTFANLVATGNVSIAGTLTYEDVTNVDSIGIVTARTGVRIDAGGIVVVGVTTVAAGTTSAPSISPTGDSDTGIFFPSADTIAFGEGGAEAARFDSDGRLLIDTSTSRIVEDWVGNGPQGLIQIEAANSDGIMSIISAGTVDAQRCGTLSLGRHRNATVGGTPTVVQDGDALGAICFAGGDGTDMRTKGASIRCEVDGTPASNDMPGRIVLATTADGASSPTEAMRINNQQELLVGTATRNANGGVLQLKSGITFPATAVAASDANTLDDYEEGTWTPVYTGSAGSIGATAYTQQAGTYTKIGRQVTAKMRVALSSKGSWTGAALFTGLPFTAINNSQQNMGSMWTELVTFADQINARVGPNEATLVPRILTSGTLGDYLQTSGVTNTSAFYATVTYFI